MIAERLDKLSSREKLGLFLALFFVFVVAIDRLAVQFITDDFQVLNEQIEKERIELKSAQRIASGERFVAGEYRRVRPRLGHAASLSGAMDEFKVKVDEMARESGVIVVSMKDREMRTTEATAERGFAELAVEIGRFESGMKELLSLLHRVRSFSGIMRVSRITMAVDKDTGQIAGSMVITSIVDAMLPTGASMAQSEPRP
jgi:hypothetical protein